MVLRDLLGKLVMETKLLEFLERLLGEPVAATDTISVSSTQRARIIAWLNDNDVPVSYKELGSNLIPVPRLLNGASMESGHSGEAIFPPPVVSRPVPSVGVLGIGIDIQARSSMPEATDFRTDRFYASNFSPRELAHCIQQGDPLSSLAGIWAAKEAILKAGAAVRDSTGCLATVEISHLVDGSPQFPNCLISISHDHGVAVAVCIRLA